MVFENHRKSLIQQSTLRKLEPFGQTVLPDMSLQNKTKIGEKCQNSNIEMQHFE